MFSFDGLQGGEGGGEEDRNKALVTFFLWHKILHFDDVLVTKRLANVVGFNTL